MPKNLGSIDFGQFKEIITQQLLDAIKDLPEEEKAKLISRLEQKAEESKDEIWYTHDDSAGNHILSGYSGADVNVIFPDTIDGGSYEISGITFRHKDIESITISKGVTSIGRLAFAHCDKLKKVTFADGFAGTIMNSAFFDCISLEEFSFPPSITEIEPIVNKCHNLSSVYIPHFVTQIAPYAFSENENLKNIYFDGTKSEWAAVEKGYRWSYGMGDYTVYCQDGKIVTRKKMRKPAKSPQTPKCIAETQISPEEETTEYVYCEVEVDGALRQYSYITDDESICEGDKVVVPFGSQNLEAMGVVANIIRCTGKNAPYPPSKTKKVLRKHIEK